MLYYRSGYAGLYVHFPYCIHKCSYCDFYSVGIGKNPTPNQQTLFENYRKEFDLRLSLDPKIMDYKFDTIFIGQGVGGDGLAALNIVLPIYSLVFGVGYLIGVGGSTVLGIERGRGFCKVVRNGLIVRAGKWPNEH